MPNNKDLLAALAVEVVRDLDLGEYADTLAGQRLQVRVNPPGVIEEVAGKALADLPREKIIVVVCLFIGSTPDEVGKLDDALLYWIYGKSLELYNSYHEQLRKNSPTR
jgi:hypothetical protein